MKTSTNKRRKKLNGSQRLIKYLAEGHSLTVVQSIFKFQYQELRSILPKLNKQIGLQYCSDYVEGKPYKRYWLCPKWLKTAKAQRVIKGYTSIEEERA